MMINNPIFGAPYFQTNPYGGKISERFQAVRSWSSGCVSCSSWTDHGPMKFVRHAGEHVYHLSGLHLQSDRETKRWWVLRFELVSQFDGIRSS